MKDRFRVGIAGVCHVHVHNVAWIFKRHPLIDLVAAADTPPSVPEVGDAPYTRRWNMDYLIGQVGIPRRYEDYREMLEREKLDIVICNSDNAAHPDVVDACGSAGSFACIEKPMAGSLADARKMVVSAEAAGIGMAIHWYMPFAPMQLRAKQLIDEGAIGSILQMQMRAAHAGPLAPGAVHPGPNIATEPMTDEELGSTWWYRKETGGGAMIDFCSYGCAMSRWFLGETAASAYGTRANLNSPWSEADDTGTIVARFGDAIGLFEGSWATRAAGVASGPIFYGSEGTLVVHEHVPDARVSLIRPSGEVTDYDGLAIPDAQRDIAHTLVHHLQTGAPLHPTLDPRFNLEAMAMLDAGLRSAETRREEAVDVSFRAG